MPTEEGIAPNKKRHSRNCASHNKDLIPSSARIRGHLLPLGEGSRSIVAIDFLATLVTFLSFN
jgi:hypothetical protein